MMSNPIGIFFHPLHYTLTWNLPLPVCQPGPWSAAVWMDGSTRSKYLGSCTFISMTLNLYF